MLIVTSQIAVNNASVDQDLLVIHTTIVTNHQNRYANQIHALPMDSVSFKTTVNQFVSVHSEWAVIQRQLDATIMNVIRTAIAPKIMHA